MKGLRKYLTPFAPDQSGAVSVLYELGGLIVICDAGGCAGNVCGFDEPRWFQNRSAVFSAGLRDMDAIMGRDDLLIKKLADCSKKIEASFAAIIGTPVPAVIGTDYKALMRMAEKKTGLPVLSIDTSGTHWFDQGEKKAWNQLVEKFVTGNPDAAAAAESGRRIGVWGMTPLELSSLSAGEQMVKLLGQEGYEQVDCYGMGAGIDRIRTADRADINLVVAPSAYEAACSLQKVFGTPFEVRNPLAGQRAKKIIEEYGVKDKKILVVDQQVSAITMRKEFLGAGAASVCCGTWFSEIEEYREEGDVSFKEEEDFPEFVKNHEFDMILADPDMFAMIPEFTGEKIELTQFAVSGRMAE